ncbi:MAG: PKD domain-containing protein [Vicingaceae bacterium]
MIINLMRFLTDNISKTSALGLFLAILFLALFQKTTFATHAMGMDLTYEQISQDTFLIRLAFYRDCSGVAAPNNATLRVRSASCNENFNITLPRVGTGTETTPVCASLVTQCNGGTFPGSEEYIYQRLIVLPAQCTDWVISNNICCRNNSITTIFNPGNQNIFVEAKINNFNSNSSPVFSNNPVPFVCSSQNYCFNNGAVDPEGDSLVYVLVTPRTNVNAGDTVSFKAGFNKYNPLTSTPTISLDPSTGDLCMFPTDSTQIAILAIRVEEYRNGVLVGSIMRDIQLRIIGCPNGNSLPLVSGIDSTSQFSLKACANSNISFSVFTLDPDTTQNVTMTWNQAIPGATFNFTAGARPVGTFSWTPNNSHIRSQPFCFTVTVRDDNCPFNGIQVFSYCIYVVGVRAIVDSLINPLCPGDCNGRATATVINGIPPFTYSWDDPLTQTSATADSLCAGNYIVAGTDSTGCTTYDSITLSDPLAMVLTMDSIPVSCNGGSDGKAIASVLSNGTAPFSFLWGANSGMQMTDTATNLAVGTHFVTTTDVNNCQVTDSVVVTEPTALSLTMINVSNVSCNGNNDGEAAVQVSGGSPPYTYQWGALSGLQLTDTAFMLTAGLHVVTITDSKGCISIDSVIITEPSTAITLTLSTVDINCKGDSTGSATVVPSGGSPPYFYNWDANTGNQTTQTAVNLPAGTYGVIVTDTNNCVAFPNIAIIEPDTALTLNAVDSFVQCFADVNGVAGVNVVGGTPPYSYQWDAGTGNQTTAYASSLSAGTYDVVVTDSKACSDSVSVNVLSASAALQLNLTKIDVSCNNGSDGSAKIAITGGQPGYTIVWDTLAGPQTGDSAVNLKAGSYQVQVVDSFGCTIDTIVVITEPPPLLTLATASSDVSCRGDSNGAASVVVSGGTPPYGFQWSANTGGQTNDTAIGLKAGVYFVTVFDSNYCITSPAINVFEPAFDLSGSILEVSDAKCFAGNDGFAVIAGIGGTGPYTYEWDTLAGLQTSDTAKNLSVGNYGVTVIDFNNCTFDTTVTISQPSSPLTIVMNSVPVSCFGGTDGSAIVTKMGGTPPYSVQWDSAAFLNISDTAIDLSSGYYTVVVTDANGCSISDSVFIDGPAEPVSATLSTISVTCFGRSDGEAIASASGGTAPYNYNWGPGASNQVNDTAVNLPAGTYSVTVSDANSCDTTYFVSVTEPDLLEDSVFIASSFNGTAIRCFGDSNAIAAAAAFGGTAPYTFLWDSTAGSQVNDSAFGLKEGVYNVTITDSNGCTTSNFISIGSPQKMSIGIGLIKPVSCKGGYDGKIVVNGLGGNAPYSYTWNTLPVTVGNTADSLTIGTYTVTVTDTNLCTFDTTLSIGEPDSLYVNAQAFDTKCFDQASGMAVALAGGGSPPYAYFWEISPGNFQLNDTATSLDTGTYIVLVRDNNACEITDTVYVGQPDEIVVSVSAGDTICALQPVGLSATAIGGFTPYIYNWTPFFGTTGPSGTVAPAVSTTYSVVAVDNNNCESDSQLIDIEVRTLENDVLDLTTSGDICEGDSASIFALHVGPYGNYTYRWSSGQTGPGTYYVKPDTATYYTFTVTDPCQNTLSDSVLINVFPNPALNLDDTIAMGCEPLLVSFSENSNSGMNVTYNWNFGDGNGSSNASPSYLFNAAGVYDIVLTLTSTDGCTSDNAQGPSKVVVTSSPQASFTATPNLVDERNPIVSLQNNSTGNGNSYLWIFGDGDTLSTTSSQTFPHLFSDTGAYLIVLIASNEANCSDTAVAGIVVEPYYRLEIPNAFTPATGGSSGGKWIPGDLSNHIFFPYTKNPEAVTDFEMKIFNRWGELIFESTSIYVGWDGYYRNKLSSQEVYVYKIKLTWENGQQEKAFGDVTLFR